MPAETPASFTPRASATPRPGRNAPSRMLTKMLHAPDAALAARGLAVADPDVARLDDVAARDHAGIRHWAGARRRRGSL